MEPVSLTHDNFDFTRTKKPLKRIIRTKQKTKRRTSIPETQTEESPSTQDIHVDNLPPVLASYTICIHHSTHRSPLTLIAEGMGATVVTEMTATTTHLVIEPKNEAKAMKVVKQASNNGVICSSPQWLMECYEKRMHLPAVHFPYAMEKNAHVLSEPSLILDPFANDYIDFDAEESRRANGGQTNLDDYITRARQQQQQQQQQQQREGSVADQSEARASTPFDSHHHHQQQPSISQAYNLTQDGPMDEHEEMTREFYYNSNESSGETEQTRQDEEKALQAQQSILQRLAAMEKEPPREKKTLQSGFGERLRIWYGEHALRPEEARKRKAVQSVLDGAPSNQQQQRLRTSSTTTAASGSASTPTTRRQATTTAISTARRQPVQYHQLKKPRV